MVLTSSDFSLTLRLQFGNFVKTESLGKTPNNIVGANGHFETSGKRSFLSINKYKYFSPHTPDRLTPSQARCAENCGSALTHR